MRRGLIITINLLIMGFILLFIIRYANTKAEERNKNEIIAFEKMTVTTNQIIANYLEDEQHICDVWANYINRSAEDGTPMTAEDAVSYIRKARESKSEAFSAHPFKYRFFTAPAGDDGGYFINSISICFSVNNHSRNIEMANEFMRFLISRKELGNMAGLKRLITPADDFSADGIYSALADIPADRSFSDKETGLLDPAVRQFRAAIYAVGNGTMTVDEAIAAYGNIPGN